MDTRAIFARPSHASSGVTRRALARDISTDPTPNKTPRTAATTGWARRGQAVAAEAASGVDPSLVRHVPRAKNRSGHGSYSRERVAPTRGRAPRERAGAMRCLNPTRNSLGPGGVPESVVSLYQAFGTDNTPRDASPVNATRGSVNALGRHLGSRSSYCSGSPSSQIGQSSSTISPSPCARAASKTPSHFAMKPDRIASTRNTTSLYRVGTKRIE
jgi:hypothetical protein